MPIADYRSRSANLLNSLINYYKDQSEIVNRQSCIRRDPPATARWYWPH